MAVSVFSALLKQNLLVVSNLLDQLSQLIAINHQAELKVLAEIEFQKEIMKRIIETKVLEELLLLKVEEEKRQLG